MGIRCTLTMGRYANMTTVNGYTIEPGVDLSHANLRGADLRNADLRYADLRYVDLRVADLRNADLRYADLRYADLRNEDLRSVNLRYADLRYADLRNEDLRYGNLRGADLHSAKLNWNSHDLIAEILRQHAGNNPHRLMLAGWVLMARNKCWDYWLSVDHHEKQWALDVLSQWEGMPR
jgi:uncharacterized protein YjbI with pentapeptide repeats